MFKRTGSDFKPILIFPMIAAIMVMVAPGMWGQSWSTPKRLTWNSGGSSQPVIARDSSDNLHIIWHDDSPGNDELFYKKSTDGGTTWIGLKRLTWTAADSTSQEIVTDSSDHIHCVYVEKLSETDPAQIFYKKSTNSGTTWSPPTQLTWNTGESFNPDIAVNSSNWLFVVWTDNSPGNFEIYSRKSSDQGNTWSAIKRLTWNTGFSSSATIAIDTMDTIHIGWSDSTPGNDELFYKNSTDNGVSYSMLQRITWNGGASQTPHLSTDISNNVHLFWADRTPGNLEIYYKKSTNNGSTWTGLKRLTWNSGDSKWPRNAVGVGNDHLHVFWYDFTVNSEIYYKNSSNGGSTWSALNRITWTSSNSFCPDSVVDSTQTLHLIYYDNNPGNYEIYYRNRK